MEYCLARNNAVPALVRIACVEHDFSRDRLRQIAREIGDRFQRNRQEDDFAECRGIERGSRGCAWSGRSVRR